MSSDTEVFKEWLQQQENLTLVKGKYISLTTMGYIEEIKKICTFKSPKNNFPFLFFQSKVNFYLGITLARQSSDLLVLIAKKLLNKVPFTDPPSESNYYLIQYMLPQDFASLKLILLRKFNSPISPSSLDSVKNQMIEFQAHFVQSLKKIVDILDK